MPLRNRVDPFGQIHAVPARGMFTGNRGVIHDPDARTLDGRRWTTKAWIICSCTWKGVRREVMGRNAAGGRPGWTELFFLDEVTALAAGHRPCFACRRERARDYAGFYGDAFGIDAPKVAEMDARLHRERLASGGAPDGIEPERVGNLPDGAMIAAAEIPFAIRQGRARRWSFEGYGAGVDPGGFAGDRITLVTPAASLAVLAAGYRPVWHPSADA